MTRLGKLIVALAIVTAGTAITAIIVIENQARIFDNCTETSYDPDTLICTYMGDKWFVKRVPSISDRQLPANTALQGTLPLQKDDTK